MHPANDLDHLRDEHRLLRLQGAPHGVDLWWCDLARSTDEINGYIEWLSPEETARAARFGRQLLRDRYIAGRATLRLLLAERLGILPNDVQLERGRRGRPRLRLPARLDFNVSHTAGIALVAIGEDKQVRIGVDIERSDRVVNADGLAHKFLTPDEVHFQSALALPERRRRFLRYWTYKEAMSKATGDGIGAPFRGIAIDIGTPKLISGPPPYVPELWQLHCIDVAEPYLAALAVYSRVGAHRSSGT